MLIKGGIPVRGVGNDARARQGLAGPGLLARGRTLAQPGSRLYPETGNGGYTSVHSDVYLNYDAPTNLFLPGTHVDLHAEGDAVPDRVQPRLRALEHDHERVRPRPGHDRQLGHDQRPAGDVHVQAADLPRRPERPGRSRSRRARRRRNSNPVNATNPNPPACAPTGTSAALQGVQCPANKLVITPAAPIPAGTDYTVTVNYTGRPGVHVDGDGLTEGWFRNNNAGVGDGALRHHRAGRHDGLDAAQQPPDASSRRTTSTSTIELGRGDRHRPHVDRQRPPDRLHRQRRRTRTSPAARAPSTGSRRSRSRTTWSRTASATTT